MSISTNKLVLATAATMMVAVGWWLREDRPAPGGTDSDLPVSARPAAPSPAPPAERPVTTPADEPDDAEPGLETPTRDASGVALNPAVEPLPRTVKLAAGAEAPVPPVARVTAVPVSSPPGNGGDFGTEADNGEPPADLPPVTLLENHRTAFRRYAAKFGGNPVGDNAEITAALRGQNRHGSVFLSATDGLRINREGQAVDNWGTPYFFHQLSRTEMEVRSAGPDRRMWTGDDLVVK